jgi:YD repeat-containing protein
MSKQTAMKNTQLNALGAFEDLELFDSKGNRVYKFITTSDGFWFKYTYDSNGNELTYEDSTGFWHKITYDSKGNQLTYEDSDGFWNKYTYNSNGKELTYEDSDGFWNKLTYDSNGNELTYENSNGVKRGFDIPEFTMEELIEKLGYNFKIKK